MADQIAQDTKLWSNVARALGLIILITGCHSCKRTSPPTDVMVADECTLVDDQSLAVFKPQIPGCVGSRLSHAPNLYAHFFEQSLHKDICFEDVLYDKSGYLMCAPGPYLIDEGNVVDAAENEWQLSSTPDYFVWHLENRTSFDESFYITNQQGFPLKSQSLRLQNDKDATVVLLPKAALIPGAKYYVYLVVRTATKSEKWVQPITASNPRSR